MPRELTPLKLVFLLIPILFALHFSDGVIKGREFINYDDLGLIKAMLNTPFSSYFQDWLPNRNNHAYPLRDITYFFDQWLSQQSGIPFYWFTQLVFFSFGLLASGLIFRALWPHSVRLGSALTILCAIHPINIEIVQWMMNRKHVMALLFLWFATALMLKKRDSALTHREWVVVGGLYVASLLSFPTGLLWLPWALWMQRKTLEQNPKLRLAIWSLAGLCIALYMKITTSGEADYDSSLTGLLTGERAGRALFFAWHSLGRGFWNLIFPFQLAPYYSEHSILSNLGLLLFAAFVFGWFRLVKDKKQRALGFDLLLLNLAILAPSALVFLGFPDFVWADRYAYTILPTTLALLTIAGRELAPMIKKNKKIVMISVALWGLGALVITLQRVPLWRNAIVLMSECARHEKSPKCIIQTAMREVHQGGCAPMKDILEFGRKLYSQQSAYATEFKTEMPFYDALCVALNKHMSPEEKLEKLPYLLDTYNGAGEVMFSLILAQLQARRLGSAYRDAQSYFLSGDPRPIITSRNAVNIYRGASQALCELVQDPDCEARKRQFLLSNEKTLFDSGYKNWGYNLIMTMAHEKQK